MNTPSIKELQQRVNEIAAKLGSIETMEKLRQAQCIAAQDATIAAAMQEVVKDALAVRWRRDSTASMDN